MGIEKIVIFISVYLTINFCYGQVNPLDSCGLDANPVLNKYEIIVINDVMFSPIRTKKAVIDTKEGFDFKNKKIAFYSCTKNSNTKGDGLLSKIEFFNLFKPKLFGHAGRGIIVFNEKEKKESNGFDAVIIIDCPYDLIKNSDLIQQLLNKYE